MHLITWHGTIVSLRADGRLLHLPLPLAGDAPPPLALDGTLLPSPLSGPRPRPVQDASLGTVMVAPVDGGRLLTLARDGRFLCAEAGQPILSFSRDTAAFWEYFLPFAADEFALLQHILCHRWIVRGSRQVLRRSNMRLAENFRLQLGSLNIDLVTDVPWARGEGAAPALLNLPNQTGRSELILASPDASPFLPISKWSLGSRRGAQLMALAAHRDIVGSEPIQSEFDDSVNFLRARGGAAGLLDLLESLQEDRPRPAPAETAATASSGASVEATLHAWAMREIAPWRLHPVTQPQARQAFEALNNSRDWFSLFEFADGGVTLAAKPEAAVQSEGYAYRTQLYLDFFRAVAQHLSPGFATSVCMTMGDKLHEHGAVPLFCFQKKRVEPSVLLPDIDFLIQGFYQEPYLQDPYSYAEKQATAVFAGSTTGAMINEAAARGFAVPRLRAANYFVGNPRVDFRLPSICQCTEPAAEAFLRAQPFCQKPILSWPDQFDSRFIISIDGNGATCSRVVIALRSHSVLLKYDSEDLLYYFGGLQPWLHYVPVAQDADIDKILDLEAALPDRFAQIAAQGRQFADAYLTRAAALQYTAILLRYYAESFPRA